MKNGTILFLLVFISFSNFAKEVKLLKHIQKVEHGDLDRIIKNRYLRILTTKNPFDYYIANGEVRGMQYEMSKAFVENLNQTYLKNKSPKIVFEMIPVDFDQLIPMLLNGKGDIIAVGMTKTKERKDQVRFTVSYQSVDDAIVTRKELENESYKNKTFFVQKDSSYFHELKKHDDLEVEEVNPNLNADNIMEMIAYKKFDYTLVNSFWAENLSKRFSNLVVLKDRPFRKNVEISWAIRRGSPKLLKELNTFMPKMKKGSLFGNVLTQKYFSDLGRIQSAEFDLEKSKISQYDSAIKKYSKMYGFDWRLMSAVSLQESRFNQDLINKWGAIGLFQIKQMTAEEPYINITPIHGKENFDKNIEAGIKYLAWIKKTYFNDSKVSQEDQFRFTLAAYNAGPKRVKDAIEKAKMMNLNPNIWFRNVELAMLELGFNEPVIYVSEINKHFVSYILLGIKD